MKTFFMVKPDGVKRINDGEVSKEDALKLAEETYKNL